jgi:hypothetical protein
MRFFERRKMRRTTTEVKEKEKGEKEVMESSHEMFFHDK